MSEWTEARLDWVRRLAAYLLMEAEQIESHGGSPDSH